MNSMKSSRFKLLVVGLAALAMSSLAQAMPDVQFVSSPGFTEARDIALVADVLVTAQVVHEGVALVAEASRESLTRQSMGVASPTAFAMVGTQSVQAATRLSIGPLRPASAVPFARGPPVWRTPSGRYS